MSNGDNEGIIEEGIGKEITQDLTLEFFHQLNQHEALALASLHSKLYHVANPKLYRNIDVYAS
ncbi:unnamed protein product [Candida parapsilosis]